MSISPGLYNRTLVLQRQTLTNDGMGGQTETWADAGSFRGRISYPKATERLSQGKETMITTPTIFCDNMNVMPDDRIRWGTYYFEIVGISNPSETYHHLEIDVREINYP